MIFEGQDVIDSIVATEMMFNYLNDTYDGNGKIYLIAHNGIPFDFVYLTIHLIEVNCFFYI